MSGWDVHTHLIPPTVLAAAERGEFGLAVEGDLLTVDGYELQLGKLADPGALLRWVDEQQLDGAVVSVPPVIFRYDQSAEWVALVNQGLRELAELPQLRVLGHLPLHQTCAPRLAAALGAEGVFSGFALGTPGLSGLDPVWQVLDSLGAFTLIHPQSSPDSRLDAYYLTNLLGNPYETGLAAAELVFGDVPARFPGIRFCLAHGGGVTAALAGRWQRGIDTARPGIATPSLPVAEALQRFVADDLVHDPAVLPLLESTFGQVVAGSDWPFPMGADQLDPGRTGAVGELTRPLGGLSGREAGQG